MRRTLEPTRATTPLTWLLVVAMGSGCALGIDGVGEAEASSPGLGRGRARGRHRSHLSKLMRTLGWRDP